MPYDLMHSSFSLMSQKDVATGQTVDREGVLLVGVLEGGVEKVQKCGTGASQRVLGWAVSDNESIATDVVQENLTIPASPGPYTVQLAHTGIVANAAGSATLEEIIVTQAGTPMTQINGAPAAGEFDCARTTGILTFNVAQAGLAIVVRYRYSLTVAEARQKFFQRNINNDAGAVFNTVVVGAGQGEIHTYEYDVSDDWAAATTTTVVRCGADGKVTLAGAGQAVPAHVVKVPTVDSPTLGLRFTILGA